MTIPQLSEVETRAWTREEKDRWWLANVFRGDMPQLTLRAAVTGFLLGGLLSATNLYVGAKTGWTLGVGLTSVILAFAAFKLLTQLGARDMTILENNCTQSIATAAGYMTSALVSGLAAWMWIQNELMPWWRMLCFNLVLSLLGVLVAFPMKRRFINDEQQPFPEGRACGVVLDTLYSSAAAVGMFKAKALAISAALAGATTFLLGESYMRLIQEKLLRLRSSWHLPQHLDEWFYPLAERDPWHLPNIAGVDIRELALRPSLDLAMFGAGGLMGIRAASSMFLGMLLNFAVIVPWMIVIGEIVPKSGSLADGTAVFGRVHILNTWALWWGISIMVVASLVSLFAKPQVFVAAYRYLFPRRGGEDASGDRDVLAHIELPLWVSFTGVPILGAVGVWLAHVWFGVPVIAGTVAIALILVLTLIIASSTALTGITPTGSISKIPQFLFGANYPHHPPTNIMTAVMCVEVASNASNLLMDIKPGYMLGAKPRQQAIGHCIGIVAGALASTPLFYILFLSDYQPGADVQSVMAPEDGQFGFPSALQFKGVSDLVTSVFGGPESKALLTPSILWSMGIAAAAGLIFEVARIATRGRFPLSPLAIGLGVVVPPDSTMAMFAGAFFFWLMDRVYAKREGSTGRLLWVETYEPICAGIIAGAALVGIGDVLVKVFLLQT